MNKFTNLKTKYQIFWARIAIFGRLCLTCDKTHLLIKFYVHFHILYTNCQYVSNIPSAPAYGVYSFTVNPLCQSLSKLSGLHGAWESAHYKVVEPGVSKNQTGSNT